MKSTTLTASFSLTEPQISKKPALPESKLRVLFFGTPDLAAAFLNGLFLDVNIEVVGVVCQPDELTGRKKILNAPPVKLLAQEFNRPIFQPTKLTDSDFNKAIFDLKADIFVVVAYGRILPKDLLNSPRFGTINVHPSLLPLWRGPSPLQAAIANGDETTGITIMKIDAEMDHGPILAQETIQLKIDETLESLTKTVINLGVPLLIKTLKDLSAGLIEAKEQDHTAATYCKLLKKSDGLINWLETAESIERKIRAYNPWPGMNTTWQRQGQPINIKISRAKISPSILTPGTIKITNNQLLVGTSSTALEITELQPAGGKKMKIADFIQGYSDVSALK